MNQLCRVCGEPAAGFHFGAFTCEGCKSFFGRTCNNVSSLGECKNGGTCVINRKNRTACKACRLRKCLGVGMSKSGSRYGRRSNWFKIHCLLQDQANPSSTSSSPSSSNSASTSISIEETKRLLDKLQSSNLVSPDSLHDKDTKSDDLTRFPDEGNCSSSPTVSSTDAQELHPLKEASDIFKNFMPYQWLNLKNDPMHSDILPIFAALSPFLVQPGLQFPLNHSQIQAFSQYLPFLSYLANSNNVNNSLKYPFTQHENREVSITKISNGDFSPSRVNNYVHLSKDAKGKEIKSPVSLMLSNEASPTLKFNNRHEYESSDSEDCETKISSEIHSTQDQRNKVNDACEDSIQSHARNDATKLKAIFIDRMKRSSSPEEIQTNYKKFKRFKSSGSLDHVINLVKSGLPHHEQNEPIDLSVKNCQVLQKPLNNYSPLLACSMTVTPLSPYHNSSSSFLASSGKKSFLVNDGKEQEDPEKGSTSAINLSCHG